MKRNTTPAIQLLLFLSCFATTADAAVTLNQVDNSHDRSFERLPDLQLLRGSFSKEIHIAIDAETDESWTLSANSAWMLLSETTGTGPSTVVLTFDHTLVDGADDLAGQLSVSSDAPSDGGSSVATLDVNLDIWPKIPPADATSAELRAFVKNRDNWPSDSSYKDRWELWGFLPDEETHPDTGAGENLDAWEGSACAEGSDADDCVSEDQAGLASGQSADLAWLMSVGDPRVVIAVLDSGIKWDERNLLTKHYINAAELRNCPPVGADPNAVDLLAEFDVNKDGVFNIRDYDTADWLTDLNMNGMRDPQDLIYGDDGDGACSDGIDDDGNGYVDDISGWDFFWNDNDPSDDTSYGHGTTEANWSAGEAHDGRSSPGVCPRCMVLNVRVGDSFVVDANQFADGVVFAVESGAQVVQEALGSVNNTAYTQKSVDYAYYNNVAVIASAADETSYHHNYPGNAERTFYVHAIVADTDGDFEDAATFLNYGNCTNYGGKLMLSTPGTGCSSEATGRTAGHAGLVYSYFAQLKDAATGDEVDYFSSPLTAEEVYQVLVASADDIDVPGMEADPAALEAKRYPSNEGWDLHFGYGRNNSQKSLIMMKDKMIPPEARINYPRWFQVIDPARNESIEIRGTVGSPRLTDLSWKVYVSEGILGQSPVEVASGTGSAQDAVLATVSLSADGPLGEMVRKAAEPAGDDPEKFSATLMLEVTGTGPNGPVTGRFRKSISIRQDDTMLDGFPVYLGASGESSPKVTDLDGDGIDEIVVGTADGLVHAITSTGDELPGFPVAVNSYQGISDEACDSSQPEKCYRTAAAFQSGTPYGIDPATLFASIVSTVAVGDLDGDGAPGREIAVTTMDGTMMAFTSEGELMPGFPVAMNNDHVAEFQQALSCVEDGVEIIGCRSKQRFAEQGFFSSPLLYDLDGDGDLEIAVGGMDQWAYAWHHTGELVTGWPVHLVNSVIPEFDSVGDIFRHDGRIIGSPTVADLFGDGTPYIVVGTNERKENSNEAYLYAIHPEGNSRQEGPFPEGWPSLIGGFVPDEILPFVGRGNPNSPASGDTDGDGKDEVLNAGMGGFMVLIGEDGVSEAIMESTSTYYGENSNVDEPAGSVPVINNPSIADLDGDGRLDIINGTAGFGLVQVASNGGLRAEFDHSVSAWIANNGYFQLGFPHRVWDYQFFMNYAVADLDGSGSWNVISGDGGYHVYAPNYLGEEAPGFPKFTNQWHIATPAVGDINGDQKIDVVANTREGWLYAWTNEGHVGGSADSDLPAIQWAGFHHDDMNTGNYGTPLPERTRLLPIDEPEDEAGCGCAQTEQGSDLPGGALLLGLLAVFGLRQIPSRARSRHLKG